MYDHLGNTRVVYNVNLTDTCNLTGGVIFNLENVQDYYPYGKTLRKFTASQGQERFLTTQHERDEETGLDYRGARFYDAEVGRFLSLDPLAASFTAWSAYNYVLSNPIAYIDPTGREPESTEGEESEKDEELSGWTETNAWLATGFNGSIDEFTDHIETRFVDEQGNTIVETDDSSDEVIVIKNSNQENFVAELNGKVETSLDKDASENNKLGNKYGFNLKDIYSAYGFKVFENDPNFNMGYICGYQGVLGACAGTWASMGEGKGGGGPSYGNEIGKSHRKQGLIPLTGENTIGTGSPIYSIISAPIFSNTDRIIGYNRTLKKN